MTKPLLCVITLMAIDSWLPILFPASFPSPDLFDDSDKFTDELFARETIDVE